MYHYLYLSAPEDEDELPHFHICLCLSLFETHLYYAPLLITSNLLTDGQRTVSTQFVSRYCAPQT